MLERIPLLSALPAWTPWAGLVAVLVFIAFGYIKDEIKIRRLGGHAPAVKTWVPFGITVIYDLIQHMASHNNLIWWDKMLSKFGNPNAPHTVEFATGMRRLVMTVDPDNIKAVLATQFNDFGKGPSFNRDWHEFLGDSIFSTDATKWQESRALIRPQFIKDRVSDLETFEKHTVILLEHLQSKGKPVDIKDLFFRYTLDAATDFLLGRSADSLELGDTAFAQAFAEVQRIQVNIGNSGAFNFLIPRTEYRRHLATLNAFIQPFIDSTLRLSPAELEQHAKGDAGYTFLHALAAYTRDPVILRDQLVAVLLAGRDTTACTLSWMVYELARQPELFKELRAEVERVVGLERQPTYADLKGMKLLQYTMNETLRLYPVVPYNIREALKDTTLPHGGGESGNEPIGILKGSPIIYSAHYMQLSENIYPPTSSDFSDPLLFDPHRWEKWQPKPWTYIPFNGGPRLCVGQQFALTEMGYTLVRILQTFSRVEYRGPTTDTSPSPSSSPKGGKTSVIRMLDSRQMKYKSEIVLQPLTEVDVVFFE